MSMKRQGLAAALAAIMTIAVACSDDTAGETTTTIEASLETTTTQAPTTTTTTVPVTTTTAGTTTTTMDPEVRALLEPLYGQWYSLSHSTQSGGFWAHSVLQFNENNTVIWSYTPARHLGATQYRGSFRFDGEYLEYTISYPDCLPHATYRLIWLSEDRITLEAVEEECSTREFQHAQTRDRRTEEAILDLRDRNVGTRMEW